MLVSISVKSFAFFANLEEMLYYLELEVVEGSLSQKSQSLSPIKL